eukprot:scaffold7011_cov112-Isochrysis_galbana.AAC.21
MPNLQFPSCPCHHQHTRSVLRPVPSSTWAARVGVWASKSSSLEDDGNALASADACGAHRRLDLSVGDGVRQVRGDPGARGAEGVTQGNGASIDLRNTGVAPSALSWVAAKPTSRRARRAEGHLDRARCMRAHIQFAHVQMELLGASQHLWREGLVDLDAVHLRQAHARLAESGTDGRDGADAHARRRGKLVLCDCLARRNHERGSSVADARCRRRAHHSILLEGGRQLTHPLQRGVPRVLVRAEHLDPLLALELERRNFRRERARLLRGFPPRLGRQRVLVGCRAAD